MVLYKCRQNRRTSYTANLGDAMKHQRKPVKPIYAIVFINEDGTGGMYFDDYLHAVRGLHGIRKDSPEMKLGIVKFDLYRRRVSLLKVHNYGIDTIDDTQPFWTIDTIRKLLCFTPPTY